jgi:hypothetical protein
MSIARGADRFGGDGGNLGKPGVSRLADLDRSVVDELRDGKAGAGSDEDARGGSSGSDDLAGGGGQAHQQSAEPADSALEQGHPAEEEGEQRPQPGPKPKPGPPAVVLRSHEPWMGPLQAAIAGPIELSRPAAKRCYHRPSLRQFSPFFRRTLRRAPWGLFLRLTTTTRLRNHGTQLSTRENSEHRDHGAHRRR